jgi:hypothetical protein
MIEATFLTFIHHELFTSLYKYLCIQVIGWTVVHRPLDLPRKLDFVDEVERWKIRRALVDDKPETIRDCMQKTVT